MAHVEKLLGRLKAWFNPVEGSLTAFSGGVDSALVLFLSNRFLGEKAIGVIADSPSLKRRDLHVATDFCEQFGIQLRVINTDELNNPNYSSNPSNRCFFCKDTLYRTMDGIRPEYPGYYVLNGTKKDVRLLAKYFCLPVWDKPASPCLSSRIPYGQEVTEEKLRQIEAAETFLNELGFDEVRVRHFDSEARIEVPTGMVNKLLPLKPQIQKAFSDIGFETATIDTEGFVSGKLNRAIVSHG
jgi:uncharacterized protein